jgi:hypothetical protein
MSSMDGLFVFLTIECWLLIMGVLASGCVRLYVESVPIFLEKAQLHLI